MNSSNTQQRMYAVDIALLPPAGVMTECIAFNRELIRKGGNDSLRLGEEACLPHISLAMGCCQEKNLTDLCREINTLSDSFLPLEVKAGDIVTVETAGGAVSGLNIVHTDPLVHLHRTVMDVLSPYSLTKSSPDALCHAAGEDADMNMADYVLRYRKDSAYERFSPHITLGYGDRDCVDKKFRVSSTFLCMTIALCHVGRGGVCRKIVCRSEKEDQL